jgi:hypothetical protein
MTVGAASVRFYSLYFHLQDQRGSKAGDSGAPMWLALPDWQRGKGDGRTVLLNEPFEAGSPIGRLGIAGPPGHEEAQIHFEIFASDEVIDEITQANPAFLREKWELVDGTVGGRFSIDKRVNELIDTAPRDNAISRTELFDFFRQNADRRLTHNMVTLHTSEWVASPGWVESLKQAREYESLGDRKLRDMVAEQIEPTLWWTAEVAKHARMPKDGVVFHYHPITFVKYVNAMLLQARALADDGIGSFDESEARETPEGVTDDFDDVSGDSFVADSELLPEEFDADIELEELIKGFPE